MAREGLRTLVVAKKSLSEEQYQDFEVWMNSMYWTWWFLLLSLQCTTLLQWILCFLEWKLELGASLVALIFSLMLDFCVLSKKIKIKNSIQLFPLFISVVFDMFISQLPVLLPCAEPLQPGQAEYPWPNPEGCSSGREPREGDGASVSDRCGGPATSRRQAHAGAAQERWH